jgi:hypothetical protein
MFSNPGKWKKQKIYITLEEQISSFDKILLEKRKFWSLSDPNFY